MGINTDTNDELKLGKKEMDVLGRIMAADIRGGIYQGESAIIRKLEKNGYVVRLVLETNHTMPVVAKGWAFTPWGHYQYCRNCSDQIINENRTH